MLLRRGAIVPEVVILAVISLYLLGCGNGGTAPREENENARSPEIAALLRAADQFETLTRSVNDHVAREQLVSWLIEQPGVISAGTASDSNTVWMRFDSGITAALRTSSDANSKGSSGYGVEETVPAGRDGNAPLRSPESTDLSIDPFVNVMLAAPAHSDFGAAEEVPAIADYYFYFNQSWQPPILLNEQFTPEQLVIHLMQEDPMFYHLLISSHGGLVYLDAEGEEVACIDTGVKGLDKTFQSKYKADLEAERLVLSTAVGNDSSGIAFTPKFVRYYGERSGGDGPAGRFVYLSACSGAHSSMADAFLDIGAACVAGFDGTLNAGFARDVGMEFFEDLLHGMTPQESYDGLSKKEDPDNKGTHFRIYGDTDRPVFYRGWVTIEGYGSSVTSTMVHCPAGDYIDDPGRLLEIAIGLVSDAPDGELIGEVTLTVPFPVTEGATYVNGSGSPTDLRFQAEDGGVFAADDEYGNGSITIEKFDDTEGGLVKGHFSGSIVEPAMEMEDEDDVRQISGVFWAVRVYDESGATNRSDEQSGRCRR
jgi:hypothetical protein